MGLTFRPEGFLLDQWGFALDQRFFGSSFSTQPLRKSEGNDGLLTAASLSCLRGYYSNMALRTVRGSIKVAVVRTVSVKWFTMTDASFKVS